MLIPRPGKTWYWDAEGAGAGFEVGFRQVMELDGVGIAFMQGSRRTYQFDIEVSDGGPWVKVFSGRSSGKTDELEYFRFPARKVQKIRFTGEVSANNGKRVEVQMEFLTSKQAHPVAFRMLEKNNRWVVYDVLIEGISMIKNYRDQFRDILAKGDPQTLIERVQAKALEQKEKKAQAKKEAK